MAVYYSSIKHFKSKRRVKLEILEILKNHFTIIDNFILSWSFKLMYNFISINTFMNTTLL